jgi:GNAT superfamily N-acetyltransferase
VTELGRPDTCVDAGLGRLDRDEGDRRTTWLATLAGAPVGMTSLFEYRRMPRPGQPDSSWGYVSNVFVREDVRDRGIGSALLAALVAAADERGYVRLVLSPQERALPFFRRAGFVFAGEAAGDHRLLVRPG